MTAHFPIRPTLADSSKHPFPADPALSSSGALNDRDQALVAAVRMFERGDTECALAEIQVLLAVHPGWVDGHIVMAQLLSQSETPDAFEQFLADAIRRSPGELAVVTTCLRLLSEAERHASVAALLPLVRARTGDHLFFTLIEAIAASETGDDRRADTLFEHAAALGGLLSLPHVRHLIRKGEASRAATLAEAFVREQPDNQGGWGLLATAWRLTGDTRHAWLAEQPGLVQIIDIDIAAQEMDALAALLRTLHVAHNHPFNQSLRGGTQSVGKLFSRSDPQIQKIHEVLSAAVRAYLDQLPPHDPAHPLLGRARAGFHVSDSWSVRLVDGGYHISHFHPQGVLSSAFYVTLPPDTARSPAGWLTIGEPPETLRTGLPPLKLIEPKVGRLALFPSFLWHGTRPFPRGERMTIAFDTVLGA